MRRLNFRSFVISGLTFFSGAAIFAQSLTADVLIVVDAVKKQQPDMKVLCQSDGAGIRSAVTEAVMASMQQRRLRGNPMEAGTEAGAALRRECVALSPNTTSSTARPVESSADVLSALMETRSKLPKISFNLEAKTFGVFTRPHNQLLRPDEVAAKPEVGWPVVVYVPGCGGMSRSRVDQVRGLLQAGYAVLSIDSYGPRNQADCRNNVVNPGVVIGDALQALEELQSVAELDKRRIYQIGQSLGGLVAQWLSSEGNMSKQQARYRFTALVGHYTSCKFEYAKGAYLSFMQRDVSRPLLMLMAQDDNETPPETCFPLLDEMKAQGRPVSWHIYPSPATHGWDLTDADGYSIALPNGKTQTYRHNKSVTDDALRRTFDFLNSHK